MTPEMIAIARRAVACPRWRYTQGMRVVSQNDGRAYRLCFDDEQPRRVDANLMDAPTDWPVPGGFPRLLPDLTDPATLGCLLALVREAWGPACQVTPWVHWEGRDTVIGGWRFCGNEYADTELPRHESSIYAYGSEAEALVSALESAP